MWQIAVIYDMERLQIAFLNRLTWVHQTINVNIVELIFGSPKTAQKRRSLEKEVAIDADKVYLAAIDKFDAILSKNNSFAPEALYRWGMALQNRSNLRLRNNKEKIKLLNKAKSLFEEVLYLEADRPLADQSLQAR